VDDLLGDVDDTALWELLFSAEAPPLDGAAFSERIFNALLSHLTDWLVSEN
jgi:hypothetical protein